MNLAERVRERERRLREMNLARPPSPLSDLVRALNEDQAKLRRRQALREAGLGEPETPAERQIARRIRHRSLLSLPPAGPDTESSVSGSLRDAAVQLGTPQASPLPPDLQEPTTAVQEPPGATIPPPEPEAGPNGPADAVSASPAPGGLNHEELPMSPLCSACGERPVHARGLCARCYDRHRRAGTLDQVAPPPQHPGGPKPKAGAHEDRPSPTEGWTQIRMAYQSTKRAHQARGGAVSALEATGRLYGCPAHLVRIEDSTVVLETPEPERFSREARSRGWNVEGAPDTIGAPEEPTGFKTVGEPRLDPEVPAMRERAPNLDEAHLIEQQVSRVFKAIEGGPGLAERLSWIVDAYLDQDRDLFRIARAVSEFYPETQSHTLFDRVCLLVEEVRRRRLPASPALLPDATYRVPLRLEIEVHVLPPRSQA